MAMVFVVVRLLAVPQALPWQNVSEQEPGLCQLSTEIALGCGVSTLTKDWRSCVLHCPNNGELIHLC